MKLLINKKFNIVPIVLLLVLWVSQSHAVGLLTQQLTYNDTDDINPQVFGSYAAWQWEDPNGDWEIFFYDAKNIIRLTDNSGDDINPQIFGKKVVWQGWDPNDGDWEIFFYNGHSIQQLTNDPCDDINPKISKSLIVWQSWDGNDWEIDTALIPLPAGMKFTPQSLNLKSRGRWVTVHLTLPAGIKGSQVDYSSLLLMDQIPVDRVQGKGRSSKLTLKFKGADVKALLTPAPQVEIILTGQLKDGTPFEASDIIKVINPGS
ncbi:MAG: TolB family protein [Planctomycetota bacterium]|jgi:hypothetical protein